MTELLAEFSPSAYMTDTQLSRLTWIPVTAHTGAFPKPLPIGAEELMLDRVLPGPAVAELVPTAGAAGDDLGDTVALWCQRLAQELIIRERARTGDDELHVNHLPTRAARVKKNKQTLPEGFF